MVYEKMYNEDNDNKPKEKKKNSFDEVGSDTKNNDKQSKESSNANTVKSS